DRSVQRRPVPVRGHLDPAPCRRRGRGRDRQAAARTRRSRGPQSQRSARGGPVAMNDLLFNIGYGHFLVLAAVLFLIGTVGVMVRRNALIILMSVELMLNAANMTLLTFSRMWGGSEALSAHTFALIVIAVAAA